MVNSLRFLLLLGLGPVAHAAGTELLPVTAAMEPRLTAALAGLQRQPLSDDERAQILNELRAVAADRPAAESGITALYLIGRLRQQSEGVEAGDPPEFRELLRDHSSHPLAQLARVKLLMRRLYPAITDTSTPAARLQVAETMGQDIVLPSLRADFHLAMGDAYIFYGDQREPALRHLVEAERLGITSSATRGTVLVQMGELARLTNDRTLAAESYRRFLADFPRDIRQQIVRDRLAEVTAGEAAK